MTRDFEYAYPPAEEIAVQPAGGRGAWAAYLLVWAIVTTVTVIALAQHSPVWTAAVPLLFVLTVVGTLWKPLFGLCLVCAVTPLGRAVGFGEYMSLDRAVAIPFLLGVLGNLMIGRARLRMITPVPVAALGFAILSGLSILWAVYPLVAAGYTFTMFQLFIYVVLVVSVCADSNRLLWALRVFALSAFTIVVAAPLLGLVPWEEHKGRFTIAVGAGAFNSNAFATVLGVAFFTSIYLNRRDPARNWRWIWLAPMGVLPIVAVMTGSRGATLALVATLVLPLVLMRQIIRRGPAAFVGAVLLAVFLVLAVHFGVEYVLSPEVLGRYTDVEYAAHSSGVRLGFIQESVQYVLRHPLGAGQACFLSARTGHSVHADFFYVLANLGYAGGILFIAFAVAMLLRIRRMPLGWEKWYARAVTVFLLVGGLSHAWQFQKYFWLFLAFAMLVAWFYGPSRALVHQELAGEELPTLQAIDDDLFARGH